MPCRSPWLQGPGRRGAVRFWALVLERPASVGGATAPKAITFPSACVRLRAHVLSRGRVALSKFPHELRRIPPSLALLLCNTAPDHLWCHRCLLSIIGHGSRTNLPQHSDLFNWANLLLTRLNVSTCMRQMNRLTQRRAARFELQTNPIGNRYWRKGMQIA